MLVSGLAKAERVARVLRDPLAAARTARWARSTLGHVGTSFVGLGWARGCCGTARSYCIRSILARARVTDSLAHVGPTLATEDLVDARGVAEILGLSSRNSVTVYQMRYSDMPRPVVDMGPGRAKLWLRPEIEGWAAQRVAKGRIRPGRRSAR